MKHIYFIRHGETDNNLHQRLQGRGVNASLNEKGKMQAEAVAEALEDLPITKVYTSSLIRTSETATPYLSLKELQAEGLADLDEMDFGRWEGRSFEEVSHEIEDIQSTWTSGNVHIAVPGGESPVEVYERAGKKIIELIANSDHTSIAFFLHGRLIRILLSEFLGLGLRNMHHIEHANGSIYHLTWTQEEGFTEVELNKIDHLQGIEVDC